MTRWLALAVTLTCAGFSQAAPITFQLTGTVTQVPIDDLYGDILAGSPIQITYTFDSAAVDLIPADPASASYVSSGLPFAMSFILPGHVFTASDFVQIGILNSAVDQYTVLATGAGGNLTLELFLQDNSAAVFANDSLPLAAPSLGAFTIKDFHLHEVGTGGETQVDGQLLTASAVPEPSTLLALLSGAGVFFAMTRSKRR